MSFSERPDEEDREQAVDSQVEQLDSSLDAPIASEFEGSMIRGRFAMLVVLAMVIVADFTLYHAQGFMGPAVFLAAAATLLCIGIPRPSLSICTLLVAALLAVLAVRLGWNGSGLQVAAGLWLLNALAVSLRGHLPFVLETLVFAAQCIPGGYNFYSGINSGIRRRVLDPVDSGKPIRFMDVGLPLVSVVLFGGVFVMANPDLVSWMSGTMGSIVDAIRSFLFQFSLFEVAFWMVVAWLTGGLLRPLVSPLVETLVGHDSNRQNFETPLYSAFRNTLLTVIGLFGVYLLFESRAFVSRTPPAGFTYSSYAHEGAAWLTLALGMATVTLSMIFRGLTLADPRVGKLQRLAWIWSGLNFLLAMAVYNRMLIYINYNGMTRMRTVALLGITSVVVGFALVLLKIQWKQTFPWLVRRQLWVVSFAAYLYVVLPVDVLIHTYNVRQILSGNVAPIVQVTEHPIDDEALPVLVPLCQAEDRLISEGVKGLLTNRFGSIEDTLAENEALGWTAWQLGRNRCHESLKAVQKNWDTHRSSQDATTAWEQLENYAFQNWW